MKQVVQNYRTGVLSVDDVPTPALHTGGLLVANRFSLISSGTEKSTIVMARKSLIGKAQERPEMVKKVFEQIRKEGLKDTLKRVYDRLDLPAALGYSCAGTVLSVGKEAAGFSVGDEVACAGQGYASHAEVVFVPKNLCAKVPRGVDLEEAAFVTLGAIALQGVRQTAPQLGERIAVIGLGLLGQITVQLLKANGCQVVGSDLDAARRDLAGRLGADLTVTPDQLGEAAEVFTGGYGVDAVIITASTQDDGPVGVAGEISRKKGRVVIVGAVGMNFPREPYYRKELDVRMSTSYGPGRYDVSYEEKGRDYPFGYVRWTEKRNMEAFLTLVQQGKVRMKELLTHRFPIENADEAYRLMLEDWEPFLGILVRYPEDTLSQPDHTIHVKTGRRSSGIRLGVIGAGNHVRDRLLPEFLSIKDVQLHVFCTATGVHAKSLAEKYNASYCTTDYRKVLQDPEVNAVLIGTRHNLHGSMVAEALSAGKHVFVEKPLCLTEEELDRIREIYEEKAKEGIHLMVGFNRRFSSHAEKAREFFNGRKNPLTMVFRVNAGSIAPEHWIQDPDVGGGRIIGEVCHFVDYLQFLCGASPVSVHARSIARHTAGIVEDQSVLTLLFACGSIGTIIYTAGGDVALAKERLEVFGDGKSQVLDDFRVSEFYAAGKKTVFKSGKRDKGFLGEISRFIRGIQEGDEPSIPFSEISAVTRTCILAAASLRTGDVYPV